MSRVARTLISLPSVIIYLALSWVTCYEIDLTFDLPAAKQDCFYQFVKENFTLEIEYQVVDGGELDVNFILQDPKGLILVAEKRKQDAVHTITCQHEGDFKICFDNGFSSFSSKVIYMEIIVESDQGEDYYDELELKRIDFTEEDELEDYEMKLEDIQQSLGNIKSSLSKLVHFQESKRAVEARHRNIAEKNFTLVNTWSLIQSLTMLVVGILQVYLIRSLFDDKNKMHKLMTSTWQR